MRIVFPLNDRIIQAHMKTAENYASLSYAERLKVGAIVVKDDRIISIGYNGTPAGWSNECEKIDYVDENGQDYDEMISKGYTFGCISEVAGYVRRITKPEVIHAEANAIAKLARNHESGLDSDMFITHAPCMECSKLIFTAGIGRVFYKHDYRDSSGIEFLKKCGVSVQQVKEAI